VRTRLFGLGLLMLACAGCESLVDFEGLSRNAKPNTCPSGAVFCADFENGEKGAFTDQDANPDGQNDLVEDRGPLDDAHNHAMRLDANADLVKAIPTEYRRLYARWYVKWLRNSGLRAGFYGGGQNKVGNEGDRPKQGVPDEWFGAVVEARQIQNEVVLGAGYIGMYQNCQYPADCDGDTFPCTAGDSICTKPEHRTTEPIPGVEDDRWYCVELMVDAGDPLASDSGANGSVSYAIDGKSYGPFGGLWMRTTPEIGVDALWLASNSANPGPSFLLDDIEVSEAPIGCFSR
jgi:hypothetical protein